MSRRMIGLGDRGGVPAMTSTDVSSLRSEIVVDALPCPDGDGGSSSHACGWGLMIGVTLEHERGRDFSSWAWRGRRAVAKRCKRYHKDDICPIVGGRQYWHARLTEISPTLVPVYSSRSRRDLCCMRSRWFPAAAELAYPRRAAMFLALGRMQPSL